MGSANLAPEPPNPAPQRSGLTSRSSSETRHISITEPKETQKDNTSNNPGGGLKKDDDSPLSMAMRQAGAEAAAKAGQKKTGTAQAAAAPSSEPDTSEKTPTPASTKMSADAEEPGLDANATAAKTPAQLAAEGKARTSVDKIADSEGTSSGSPSSSGGGGSSTESAPSNQEQMLEARRSSSITKTPSRLATSTTLEDSSTVLEDMNKDGTAPAAKTEATQNEGGGGGRDDKFVGEAKNVGATDQAEKEATNDTKPQEAGAKDEDAVGVSIGD